MKKIFANLAGDFKFDFFIMFKSIMDLIKTEYIKEYQKEYQTEYYKNNREDISEKNRIYCFYNKKEKMMKEKKEKMIKGKKEKNIKLKKNENMNFDFIKVEKRFVTLFF